jgi:catechol 2,3-dioxygenase-like lactoylglutathione lyase family enzyme
VVRVTRFDHIHLSVGDLDRALAFYREAFGAEESFRVDELVFLRLPEGAGTIALDARPEEQRNPDHVGLALAEAEDLDAAVEAVESAGGRLVERGEHAPGIAYAYVADPDGHVLEL